MRFPIYGGGRSMRFRKSAPEPSTNFSQAGSAQVGVVLGMSGAPDSDRATFLALQQQVSRQVTSMPALWRRFVPDERGRLAWEDSCAVVAREHLRMHRLSAHPDHDASEWDAVRTGFFTEQVRTDISPWQLQLVSDPDGTPRAVLARLHRQLADDDAANRLVRELLGRQLLNPLPGSRWWNRFRPRVRFAAVREKLLSKR